MMMKEQAASPEAGKDGKQATLAGDDAVIAKIISQINSDASFAKVARAILQAACQRVDAVEATLLVVEHGTNPLPRATIKLTTPTPDSPSPRSKGSAHLSVPVRCAAHLVGLLDIYWAGEQPVAAAQRELDTFANLEALLIQREQAQAAAAAVAAKMRQFGLHKEEFVHLVAHQLRTPLTSIKGFAQLLERQQRAGNLEAIGRYGSTILHESNRLAAIVNNLMELSHMEVAMIGIRYAPFAINDVVEQTMADTDHELQISRRLAANLPACSGDRAVLKLALAQLITHARRVDDQRLSISTARADGHLNIAVALHADDWPERDSDDMQSISLDKAVDNTERRNPAMSLYVIRNLTQAMGGSLSLERTDDQQMNDAAPLSYIISLPLADGETAAIDET